MLPVVEPTPPDAFLTHMRQVGPHELFVLSVPSFDVMCETSRFQDALKFVAPRTGTVLIEQDSREVALQAGEVGLLSLEKPFRLRCSASDSGLSDLVQWRLPRELVTRRHPGWKSGRVRAIGDGSGGERVLAGLLSAFVENCSYLTRQETAASFAAIVEALGLLTTPQEHSAEEARVRRAVRIIEDGLYDPALTPELVAQEQGVTRRYLDDLLKRYGGTSLSVTIRDARLERAAHALRARADVKLLTLALSLGFENQSHFARCFKERFGVSPSQFRTASSRHRSLG
jgi:AraC family transcriptional regulator, positive regulator of tynA and feaB